MERSARSEFGAQSVGRNAGYISEQSISLEFTVLGAASPMLDYVEITQDNIHLLAFALKPGPAVHQASPGTWRKDGAARREGSEIDGAAVVETEVPITSSIAAPKSMRTTQRHSDCARQ